MADAKVQPDRMAALMDELMGEFRKQISVDDLPLVFGADELPVVFSPSLPISPQDMSSTLSPEEVELGARWGKMAIGDPLAIIPEARAFALATLRAAKKAKAATPEAKAAKAEIGA